MIRRMLRFIPSGPRAARAIASESDRASVPDRCSVRHESKQLVLALGGDRAPESSTAIASSQAAEFWQPMPLGQVAEMCLAKSPTMDR